MSDQKQAKYERWRGRAPMTPEDVEAAHRHEREIEEVLATLEPIISQELWIKLAGITEGEPDVHRGCDERNIRIIEGIARHFGPLAPALRLIGWHVLEKEGLIRDQTCPLLAGIERFEGMAFWEECGPPEPPA